MAGGIEDAALQFAETVQTASINHNPDPIRDIAPETSVDTRIPVQFDDSGDVMSDAENVGDDEVPISILRPLPEEPRAPRHLPLPDLRFEQSYLKSISQTNDWRVIAYITIKDQVLMPMVQGAAMALIVAWWRHSNQAAKFSGQTVGARIRRWWWGVNNWNIPEDTKWKPTRR